MVKKRRPVTPIPKNFVPKAPAVVYRPKEGDSWISIAQAFRLDTWNLIEFNFPTLHFVTNFQQKCEECNWYMYENIGCRRTNDGINYSFSIHDVPGKIYIPTLPPPPKIISYIVPGNIPCVNQPGNTCWAAAATMMMSWKDKKKYTTLEAMEKAGPHWLNQYVKRKGIYRSEEYNFVSAVGMNCGIFPFSDPYHWIQALKNKGLITATTFSSPRWTHQLVVYGITIINEAATFHVMDPSTAGCKRSISANMFMKDYNETFYDEHTRIKKAKYSLWFYGSPFLPL